MAQVPYNDGISTVAADATPPDDYQRVQTTPGMFGGGIAEAGERLAQATTKTADFFGEVQTDDAVNSAMKTVNASLDKFKSLNGADALRAQPEIQSQVDQAFKSGRDGLSTPMQQKRYDDITRTYQDRYVTGLIRDHADREAKTYATQTNQNTLTNALTGVTNVADDDEKVDGFRAMARMSAIRQVQNEGNGGDPDAVNAAVARADQAVVKTQAETVAIKDPARALQIVEQHKDTLGPYYAELSNQFRTRAAEQRGGTAADQAMSRAVSAPTPASGSYADKVAGVEGTTKNPGSSATGTGQFVNATWTQMVSQYRPDLAAGKTPDQILALRSDPALGREMVAHYAEQNGRELQGAGIAPTDSNLYLAHFLGGDGAVKALSAPDSAPLTSVVSPEAIQANPKVLGSLQTVGDLKAWADGKMGGGPASAKAAAYDQIMDRTDLSDQEKQIAFSKINQQYQRATIASEQDAQAKKQASDAAEGQWIPKILTNPTSVNPSDIANDPNLSPQSKPMMWDLLQKHLKDTQDGTAATYGASFYDTLKRVTAPPGDPSRLSDPSQVLRMALPGGGLTLAGAEKINGMMKQSDSAEGSAASKIQAGALAYAKHQLSFEADYGFTKIRDPQGEDKFNVGFMPAFFNYWQTGLAAGKTPAELVDPKNLDPVIAPFRRSPAELTKDQIQAGVEAPAGTTPNIPVLPQGVPAGSMFSPSRQMWKDASGKLYSSQGQPQ